LVPVILGAAQAVLLLLGAAGQRDEGKAEGKQCSGSGHTSTSFVVSLIFHARSTRRVSPAAPSSYQIFEVSDMEQIKLIKTPGKPVATASQNLKTLTRHRPERPGIRHDG
jgi:hypothetical protein